MELVSGMEAFVRAAEARSFTRAARELGVTPSGVGKAIGRLEAELGVRLLHRTTRRVALTDDGAVFLEHCRRVLDEIDEARAVIAHRSGAPRGRLRVSMPSFLALRHVLPALSTFTRDNPDVRLDVGLSDRRVNLAEEGVDVAVRIGDLVDSSLVAVRLGGMQIVTVATPALARELAIESLGDLAVSPCAAFKLPSTGRERPWVFTIDGRAVEWSPRAPIVVDGGEGMVAVAAAGVAVTQVPYGMAAEALASGALVEVLAALRPAPLPIHAVHLASRRVSPRTRAFLDFLVGLDWPLAPRPRSKRARSP